MKSTLITVLIIAALGVLGYFFYGALQDLGNQQTDYDFKPAEVIVDEFDELLNLGDSDLDLDSELDDLEGLDFEEPITEENIGEVIGTTEQEESEIEDDLNELENLDF